MKTIPGIPGSDGVAVGKVLLYENKPLTIPSDPVPPGAEDDELERLRTALESVRQDLRTAADRVRREVGQAEAEIFEAHQSVLDDPEILDTVRECIISEHRNAACAFWTCVQETADLFAEVDDDYMRARAADVLDVGDRVVRALTGERSVDLSHLDEPCILVSRDITPSDTASMDKDHVIAIVSEVGSRTSHAVILSRSLGIPAVVGTPEITSLVRSGETVIVDGGAGRVVLQPDEAAIESARRSQAAGERRRAALRDAAHADAVTLDHVTVSVQGNIGHPEEVACVLENGGDGVGLFRSEFFYMDAGAFPTEEEQYRGYRRAAEQLGGKELIVRTMDIGGDKRLDYFDLPQELNPFLGWRALRISLARPDIFKPQLRALLRAALHGGVRIMLPMVSSVEEIRAAREVVEECKEELCAQGIPFNPDTPVGIMVEIPAIALQARDAAKLVDFFSIGTNDLLQYSLAVDRMNQQVAELYRPFHPGVLRLIRQVIEDAHAEGIPVGMCGEMAGDPVCAAILLGLDLDHFSMSASSIPAVKAQIRRLSAAECREMARQALSLTTAAEVKACAEAFLQSRQDEEILP